MGGKVHVQSKVNCGTKFTINFKSSCFLRSKNSSVSLLFKNNLSNVEEMKSPRISHSEEVCGSHSYEIELSASSISGSFRIEEHMLASKQESLKPTILLVNDNFLLLTMLHDSLKSQFTVHNANNGLEALDIVIAHSRHFFDAILLDINMPIMDGFESFEKITKYLNGPGMLTKPDPNNSQ